MECVRAGRRREETNEQRDQRFQHGTFESFRVKAGPRKIGRETNGIYCLYPFHLLSP